MSPRLCLIDVVVQPKTKQKISAKCHKCGEISTRVFAELLRSVNSQAKYVANFHCAKCFRNLPEFKQYSANKASQTLAKSKEYRSKISKELWQNNEFRAKCEANVAKLRNNKEFADKVSKAIKDKFANDAEYVAKVKLARSQYYASSKDNPKTWDKEKFILQATEVHGNIYDYSQVEYVNIRTKVKIMCEKHGGFYTRPSHHIHYLNGCPQCNIEKLQSSGEINLYNWISSNYDGEIVNSDRNILDGLEIDIWIPEFNLGIEYHGAYFHSYDKNESVYQKNYHSIKSTKAHKKNITLLQFVDLDFNQRVSVAQSIIKNKLKQSVRVYARNCHIEVIDAKTAKEFFDNNHYHGGVYSSISYGLVNAGRLICVLSMAGKDGVYSIARFATLLNMSVVGGFSKLMTEFFRHHKNSIVSTYVDRSLTTGENCYSKFGMQFVGITKPGYRYFKRNKLYNRIHFQKHKLSGLEDFNFDPNLTESDNMFLNGYRRLWDAGNLKYVIRN